MTDVIRVTLMARDGGGLHVVSDDLPGLIISGPDAYEIWSLVPGAIARLREKAGLGKLRFNSDKELSAILPLSNRAEVIFLGEKI